MKIREQNAGCTTAAGEGVTPPDVSSGLFGGFSRELIVFCKWGREGTGAHATGAEGR